MNFWIELLVGTANFRIFGKWTSSRLLISTPERVLSAMSYDEGTSLEE